MAAYKIKVLTEDGYKELALAAVCDGDGNEITKTYVTLDSFEELQATVGDMVAIYYDEDGRLSYDYEE